MRPAESRPVALLYEGGMSAAPGGGSSEVLLQSLSGCSSTVSLVPCREYSSLPEEHTPHRSVRTGEDVIHVNNHKREAPSHFTQKCDPWAFRTDHWHTPSVEKVTSEM